MSINCIVVCDRNEMLGVCSKNKNALFEGNSAFIIIIIIIIIIEHFSGNLSKYSVLDILHNNMKSFCE